MKSQNKKTRFYDSKKLLLELIPLLIFIGMIIFALVSYPKLPDRLPTHWNSSGQADGYSAKTSVFLIPAIFLFILILFFILPFMEVFRDNMLKIYKYYYAFKIVFSIFFAVLFVTSLLPTLGYQVNVSAVVIGMVGLLFIALGFIFPKLKRNFMFGIRTGWTLSSDKVWEKTHKLGGWLFALTGFIVIIALFLIRLEMVFVVFISLTILISLVLVFYSYLLYKKTK